MKFFIDTANLEQIRKAHELGVLDGVTTNPSLMAKENIRGTENCNRHYVEICNIVEGDVSAEVIATDFEGMVREGEALAARQEQTGPDRTGMFSDAMKAADAAGMAARGEVSVKGNAQPQESGP